LSSLDEENGHAQSTVLLPNGKLKNFYQPLELLQEGLTKQISKVRCYQSPTQTHSHWRKNLQVQELEKKNLQVQEL